MLKAKSPFVRREMFKDQVFIIKINNDLVLSILLEEQRIMIYILSLIV